MNGAMYATAEHAFQSQKCEDPSYQAMFDMTSPTYIGDDPRCAKKCGGKPFFDAHGYVLRKDWDQIRLMAMVDILDERDLQHAASHNALHATHPQRLVHSGFRIDGFWGMKRQGIQSSR